MSNGTLQQLSSKGVQDGHLSISPETSLFKRTYKRVSNFAIESIDIDITGAKWGSNFSVSVSRNGDLLSELWLVADIKTARLATPAGDSVHWTNALGHAMIEKATFDIGSNPIEMLTGLFLEIKHELESDVNVDTDELVLRSTNASQLIHWTNNGNTLDSSGDAITQVYVKLPFYFSKARSQALPVISLQYHDLNVKLEIKRQDNLLIYSNPSNKTLHSTHNGEISQAYLMCNFVYLDSMERRLFASNSHEYLIKNLQISEHHTKAAGAARVSSQVVFNHPVTALYWVIRKTSNVTALDYFNFERTAGLGDDPLQSAVIKFNGSERERPRGALYWRKVQPGLYFNRTPRKNIYLYSFAQHPSAWYPSGSVNLSRIDVTSLEFTTPGTDANGSQFGEATISIFCEAYNVLRIQGGMAAKKYAN